MVVHFIIEDTIWYPPSGYCITNIVSHTVGISVTEDTTVTLQGTFLSAGAWNGNGHDIGYDENTAPKAVSYLLIDDTLYDTNTLTATMT